MMDPADRGNDAMQAFLSDALAKHSKRKVGAGSDVCFECGEPIPDARRQAAPGCEYCVGCQRDRERFGIL